MFFTVTLHQFNAYLLNKYIYIYIFFITDPKLLSGKTEKEKEIQSNI